MPSKKVLDASPQVQAKLNRFLPWFLVVAGVIGTLCAGIIMKEKLHLLENPNYMPACDLNPIISCGSVMSSSQSHALFGLPNPFWGLIGFPILLTIGMGLLAGAKFKRWFWLGLQAGTIFGVLFVHWLIYQSVYNISALCPYCMVVWAVTIATFWFVLLYNLRTGHISTPRRLAPIVRFAQRHSLDILVAWYVAIALLILNHFWYYFGSQL